MPHRTDGAVCKNERMQTKMKIELVLLLYDTLMRGGNVVRADFCMRYAISERTFYRYLKNIGNFLREYCSEYVIDVVEPEGKYYLKK